MALQAFSAHAMIHLSKERRKRLWHAKFAEFHAFGRLCKKEEWRVMYEYFKKNRNAIFSGVIILILICVFAFFILRSGTGVSDIGGAVDRAIDDNKEAGREIGAATDEVKRAGNELNGAREEIDRSIKSITEVKESACRSAEELGECERLIREGKADNQRAGEVLDAVRKSSKGSGT